MNFSEIGGDLTQSVHKNWKTSVVRSPKYKIKCQKTIPGELPRRSGGQKLNNSDRDGSIRGRGIQVTLHVG